MCGCALRWLLVLATLSGCPALAVAEPLWEAGAGVTLLAFSDYRGADTSSHYVLPLPYFVYRGDFLRADRNGVRGMLMERPRVQLDVSVSATTPVRSRDTSARGGMPDLDPAVELGPALQWRAWESADQRLQLEARLPVRASFAIGNDGFIGWFVAPNLNLDARGTGMFDGWNFGALTGPLFADRRYHEYFYGVAPQYATAQRSYYAARGGYSGAQLLLSATRRLPRYWLGGYVRYDRLDGAVFSDSPLMRRKSSWSGGVAVSWIFARSSRDASRGVP